MVYVKKILWLDQSIKEAEVILSDGKFDLICFSHPFNYKVNSKIELPIYVFEPYNIIKSHQNNFFIKKTEFAFGYRIIGKLIDKDKGLVKVGNYLLEIDNFLLAKDFNNCDFIQFMCERIDIY